MTTEPPEEPPEPADLRLADPASEATRTDWEAAAAAVLRKARRLTADDADAQVWEKLTRTTLDGIAITPLGTPADLDDLETTGRPTRAGAWDVRARLAGAAEKPLNRAALADLAGGVTSLWIGASSDSDFATLLDAVLLDAAAVVLDPTDDPVATAQAFLAYAAEVDLHPDTNLGADPLGMHLRGLQPPQKFLPAVAELGLEAGVRALVVDATAVHDLGASDVQELGYSMAVGANYLRVLTGAGIPIDRAAGLIEFRYAATDEQFPTIAKLRAARRLWARVLELSGSNGAEQRQHAITSRPMYSKYDPYVNMLRATVATFAAGVGGADSVTVLPFDSPLGLPDAFGRRIARNVSHLLMDESHVHIVADPGGGAYAVEKLTDDLAVAAWALFGRLDGAEHGDMRGIGAAITDGSLHAAIAETVTTRDAGIADRRHPITGLSEFPNLTEELPAREPSADGADVRRYGAAFEKLRDDPAKEPVYLATMGTIADHTARATFAANLFAAGGVTTHNHGRHDDADAVVADYAGEAVVCLCGTDAAYADWGAAVIEALRKAGAKRVIVAGKPGDLDVDDSCALGVDALAFLHRTREHLS